MVARIYYKGGIRKEKGMIKRKKADPYLELLKFGKQRMLGGNPWFSLNTFLEANSRKFTKEQTDILDDLTGHERSELFTIKPTSSINNRNREYRINEKGYMVLFQTDQVLFTKRAVTIAIISLILAIITPIATFFLS